MSNYTDHPNAKRLADPDIEAAIAEVTAVLRVKNAHYGNSALAPKQIASRASAGEALRVRIDDKLSRWANCPEGESDEDTVLDLAGYFVLLIALRIKEQREWRKSVVNHQTLTCGGTLDEMFERGIK